MRAREVIKWQKDYVNDSFVEKKCYKPNNGLKGNATILLYDQNGKLKSETFTENIIPDFTNGSESYRSIFRSIVYGGATAAYARNEQVVAFRNIILGTSDVEEDKDRLKSNPGEIIGWCPMKNTNASSDPLRGVYNPMESYEKWEKGYFHRHLVYDFNTSQGNGVFNSIWWSKSTYASTDDGACKIPDFTIEWTHPIGDARSRYMSSNDRVYNCVNNTIWSYDSTDNKYKRLINGIGYLQGTHEKQFSTDPKDMINTFIELPRIICEIPNTNGDYVQIVDYVQTNGNWDTFQNTFKIVKKNKDNVILNSYDVDIRQFENINAISSWNKYAATTARIYATEISYVDENGDVWIEIYGNCGNNSGSKGWFTSYNSTTDTIGTKGSGNYSCYCKGVFNIHSGLWVVEPNFEEINSMRGINGYAGILGKLRIDNTDYYYRRHDTDPIVTITPHETREYYVEATSIAPLNEMQSESMRTILYSYPMAHIPGENYIVTYDNNSNYYWNRESYRFTYGGDIRLCHGYSAHTKLPSPVTKTNVDTMKIQYDIYVQVPKIVDKNGNYLIFEDEEQIEDVD